MSALMKFTSHIAGKNATVEIHEDRIEWAQEGRARVGLAIATAGLSAAAPGLRRRGGRTEMIPIRQITSVTTRKDGLRNYAVSIVTAGNTIDMRVSKDEAQQAKDLITRQMLAV